MSQRKYALALHGGAGTILPDSMTTEKEKAYRDALNEALEAGWKVLESGGTALDAVEATVVVLEDCPLFNAGRGAVFTHEGKNELDASIMEGKSLDAGAVAMCTGIKNPVRLARLVMEKTDHVLLAGPGADRFAAEMGIERMPENYFYDEYRWQQLLSVRDSDRMMLDHQADDRKFGTVGAVALDQHGNLAAATSTGGMTNKKYGRIGDSPIIGAGTYANNASCAISCTGSGEYFLRANAAFHVHALMNYAGLSLQAACDKLVQEILPTLGGDGGLIGVDALGNICLSFNTEGMYRAFRDSEGGRSVGIYR